MKFERLIKGFNAYLAFPIYVYQCYSKIVEIQNAIHSSGIQITSPSLDKERLRQTRSTAYAIYNQYLREQKNLMLHLGCGTQYKNGWINIDNNSDNNIERIDINWDLSSDIPFPDNSVTFIYNEHFLEHLTYEQGKRFLHEVYRVLKPGGVVRISMPDLDLLIKCYTDDSWRSHEWVKRDAPWFHSKGFMLNAQMDSDLWGHRYIYNQEDFISSLIAVGFSKDTIVEMPSGESKYPELQNVETRTDELTRNYEITKSR